MPLIFCILLMITSLALATEKTDVIILSDKKIGSAGKEYQAYLDILKRYPLSYSQSYLSAQQALKRRRPHAFDQKRRMEQVLKDFEAAYETWQQTIKQKLNYGLYGPEKRSFYLKVMKYCNQVIDQQGLPYKLLAFHQLKDHIQVPLYDGLSFDERFLKPKYAEAYRQQKIAFYEAMIQITHHRSFKGIEKEKLLLFYTQKKKKWQARQIRSTLRNSKNFLLDDLMGITTLHAMGYKGRHVTVGVIEPTAPTAVILPTDLKKRLEFNQESLTSHGAHVSGIIGARSQTLADRLGIAPKAKIFYVPLTAATKGTLIYYQKASGSAVHSRPSVESDQALAKAFDTITHQGIKILNASFVFSLGPSSLKAFQRYVHAGGVLIKAAGNSGVALHEAIPVQNTSLNLTQKTQIGIDSGFYSYLRKDPNLLSHVVIVGNLKDADTLDASSNRAGTLAARFIGAWGSKIISTTGLYDRETLSGTSMAAPVVTGALALLTEAFPSCTSPVLSQVILDTAVPLEAPAITGQGRIDLTQAFALAEKVCGQSLIEKK